MRQTSNRRVILHVDMNSFYASVEMAYDPSLKGKPLAIAGNVEERKGIIVTCSYEARSKGVKTTMPLWQAKKLCPELIIKKPNFDRYRSASRAMFDLLREFTDRVEPVSIDEGYVDFSEFDGAKPLDMAKSIQERLLDELLLPCSIGIAPNKFLAKMASNMKKPLGISILRKRDLPVKLWPLPASEMHGIGEKTAEKLRTININTIFDVAHADSVKLKALLGINGERLKERANGIDEREVDPDSIYDFKSIGNSTTLSKNTTNESEINEVLHKLAHSVSIRMKRKDVLASKIFITIRYGNLKTITRSKKLENPIDEEADIYTVARQMFFSHWEEEPIRLLGITGQELIEKNDAIKQLDLFSFEKDAKDEPLLSVIDKINSKYGNQLIKRGVKGEKKQDISSGTSFNKDFLRE
ncbi:DNA polymerase-4 [Metabacillus crassostreae]|uniref:DNA polymerase IV n=1 Tax=Metabacillus crassostreae TaxID=929098 RepID=UPI00195E4DE6|nr:DNA polymerase IV [Metabacillus crassostreae]MBM7604536.1 DNA polymerase-4 [Metabacillus crassostreae]